MSNYPNGYCPVCGTDAPESDWRVPAVSRKNGSGAWFKEWQQVICETCHSVYAVDLREGKDESGR